MTETAGRNWWKIGFFVLLLLLEVAREAVVIGSVAQTDSYVRKELLLFDGYAGASGVWKRTDGGDPLFKTVTRIQCYRDRGECYEAAYRFEDQNFNDLSLNIYPATFSPEVITFDDKSSKCMTYSTRIDLKSKKVMRVRVKNAFVQDEVGLSPELQQICDKLDDRIEMELAEYDTRDGKTDLGKEHFLPVYSLVQWALSGF